MTTKIVWLLVVWRLCPGKREKLVTSKGEGLVFERCNLEVKLTKQNGRSKGKQQKGRLCAKRVFKL